DVARQQFGEDVLLVRLVFVNGAAVVPRVGGDDRRNELLCGRGLRDHRLEAREEQRADVELARLEQGNDFLPDTAGMLEFELAHGAQIDGLDDTIFELAFELIEALAADAEELDVLAFRQQRIGALSREANDRRVERAAQPALAGTNEQKVASVGAR